MMDAKRYKILLLGDASNYNRCLAEGLRRLGHDVTIASDGGKWMRTERDIDISRPFKGKLGGLALWLKAKKLSENQLTGFDVVSVIGSSFIALRPHRTSYILDNIIRNNKHIFFCCLGTDYHYIDTCISPDSPLRYNEWMINGKPSPLFQQSEAKLAEWHNSELTSLADRFYYDTEGTVAALYEYYLTASLKLPKDKLGYAGIPIDTSKISYIGIPESPQKVKIFLGRHSYRQVEKGTDRLFETARRAIERHPDKGELIVVEDVPYNEYLQCLQQSHVVLDQLYSYSPATNALLAMAMGKVAVSGGEPEYYDFIGEKDNRPIVNALPDDDALTESIEELLLNPEKLKQRGIASREFAIKHNDVDIVASRFINFWESKMYGSEK